jgi:hypothetical protein
MIYVCQGRVPLVKGTPWVPRKRPQPMCSSTWLLIQMHPTDMSPVQWWSECYLMEDQYQVTIVVTRLLASCWMGVMKSAGKRGGTLHSHCQVFFWQLENCPLWLKLWMYSHQNKCLWKRYNSAVWSFWGAPGNFHAVPTAARAWLSSYLFTTVRAWHDLWTFTVFCV